MLNNPALLSVLKDRKRVVEEHATSGIGTGNKDAGGVEPKAPISKLNFYAGNMASKSETGFTGLTNQGATCYLNSLIQSLYMTPELRAAVFEWRYDADKHPEAKRCIPLQLQKLFARLQISIKGAVTTKDLTTSFGWTGREVYVQHDVLELSDVLFDFLEQQSYGTRLSEVVSDLHRGSWQDYVQCLKCETFRGRLFPFVGIGLDINVANSFDEAMRRFTTPEILSGGNQYMCGKCDSKQDAKKGIRFMSFPYFLSIHFRRWTLNFATLMRIKIQKKIPFPLEFDGRKYLNSDGTSSDDPKASEGEPPMIYELYSMMIHTGGASGGHYFAYIKDWDTGIWMQFNDSKVTEIPTDDFAEFFMSEEEIAKLHSKDNNAKDDKDSVPAPIPEEADKEPKKKVEDTKVGTDASSHNFDVSAALTASLKRKQAGEQLPDKLTKSPPRDATESSKEGDGVPTQKSKSPLHKIRFLNPMGAAYGLMYRLKDPSRNCNKVASDLIPKDVVDLIACEDDIFAKQKAEFDRLSKLMNIAVHYNGKLFQVEFPKDKTMREAVTAVHSQLGLEKEGFTDDRCRLRNMKKLTGVPKEPFDDRLDEKMSAFGFGDVKHLLLETRDEGEDWPVFEASKMSLRMVELDTEKMEYKTPVIIQVEEEGNIAKLRKVCADAMGLDDTAKCRVVFQAEEVAFLLSDDKTFIQKDHRIKDGDTVHVEACAETHLSGTSLLLKKFDELLNVINLRFNKLLEPHAEIEYTESIEIDVRRPLGECREAVAKYLGIDVSKCVVRKNFNDKELKNNDKSLLSLGVGVNGHIFIELGTPLKPTQFLFQVFIEDELYKKKKLDAEMAKFEEEQKAAANAPAPIAAPIPSAACSSADATAPAPAPSGAAAPAPAPAPASAPEEQKEAPAAAAAPPKAADRPTIKSTVQELGDAFLFVGTVILDSSMDMATVKQEISSKVENLPPPEFMRIREFINDRLTKVYLDTKTLKGNCGRSIKDYKQICIQKTLTKEHLTADHIILNVGRWYPEKFDFGLFKEMSFLKTCKADKELRDILSGVTGVPLIDIRVVHPIAYQLKPKERSKICIADWAGDKLTDSSTLVSKPWKCKNGDYLIFKNVNEKERYSIHDFETGPIFAWAPREEVPLVFYSPEQQIKREAEEEEKKQQAETEISEAQRDAMARLQDTATAAAAVMKKSTEESQP